jgi:hypothetical protein
MSKRTLRAICPLLDFPFVVLLLVVNIVEISITPLEIHRTPACGEITAARPAPASKTWALDLSHFAYETA